MTQFRDLTVIPFNEKENLVIACDSSASIGMKSHDFIKAPPSIMAAYCLRVPLLELFSVGAEILSVVDLIGNEYENTGKEMLEGIKSELMKADLSSVPINGSTEENMPTVMSTIGITVIGKVSKDNFRFGKLKEADYIGYFGVPYVGTEVVANHETIFSYPELKQLLNEEGIREILPVGSKGILNESITLANSSNLSFKLRDKEIDTEHLEKSAGPATVLVIGISPEYKDQLIEKYDELTIIGKVGEK
ncbi:AIR synthase related protein [Vagococcus fessus]|uniref:PurM-like N-terminal domain-containing protein n=1 Tax=Vagococcus fessus TaxID=120370 RepID=A0A430ACY8_9ENTE|nr:AIR synthase related protein [Vagococcus fessus]RSU05087.1 hypothetical protein CBF31_03455 [Vagococcus fessus]